MKSLIAYFITIVFGFFEVNAQRVEVSTAKSTNTQVQMIYLNGSALFVKVIDVKSRSSENLYGIINAWTIATFNSAGDVVKKRVEDEVIQGVGVEPGIVLYTFPRVVASLGYIFAIEVENNKICFSMSDMNILTDETKYTLEEYLYDKKGHEIHDKQNSRIKSHATKIANVLIESLQLFLVENSVVFN
jgi:hypothetical protein